ncbi:hypothetical protein [Chryseobacterium phocaeense]|uniref:hypothetical protein n=1 Tax=Chryseobacterium phocaeense TaxID=1816690 RepID=UPI0011183D71|nr:hypothetical protein [Chryseobacterium phocaeense]
MKKLKITRLIITILFFVSCSSQVKQNEGTEIFSLINNYKFEFVNMTGEPPFAVVINKQNSNVKIMDISKNSALEYLNNGKLKEKVGLYSNIICFYDKDVLTSKSLFKNIPKRIKNDAKKGVILSFDNKKLEIRRDFIEWQPELEIIYYGDLNKKSINKNPHLSNLEPEILK